MKYKKYFKDKKITLLGLGLLGRGVGVAKFLSECGAELTVTDLKSRKELKPSLEKLKKYKHIRYVLGKHRKSDFRGRDLVIKAAGVPLDSPYVKEARKNKIPVEMDASLFAKLWGGEIIGVTGTRGKSTVTHFIYEALRKHFKKGKVYLGGNVKGIANLPLLKKVKKNDIVVMELDSWQLQGFGDSNRSPQIAVFTNFMPDHLDYYGSNMRKYFNDKANVFKYQTGKDYLILSGQAGQEIKKRYKSKIKGKVITAGNLPGSWKLNLIGEHQRRNIALAVEILKIFKIKNSSIKREAEKFGGAPGRLEFVKKSGGVSYYNDTSATTPEAAIAAIRALKTKGGIVLIAGGSDKNLDYREFAESVEKNVKALILLKGMATEKITKMLKKRNLPFETAAGMKEAIKAARRFARKGDIILLSPAAASFGVFENQYDRGEQFNRYI